eukprot:4436929-Amphidinium_carterae.1
MSSIQDFRTIPVLLFGCKVVATTGTLRWVESPYEGDPHYHHHNKTLPHKKGGVQEIKKLSRNNTVRTNIAPTVPVQQTSAETMSTICAMT